MSVNLSSLAGAGWQFFDSNGAPLAGGLLYTYAAGTTTPQATYTTSVGNIACANPIVLDAAGRTTSEIWMTQGVAYKFVLKDLTSVQIGSYDNLPGINDVAAQIAAVYAAFAASSGSSLVGFIQAYTGAVASTAQAKMRETVSVKDFGAVGDGTTNDTAAIQTAVNYVILNNLGSLYFPTGTYLCSTPVTLNMDAQNGIRLYGTSLAGCFGYQPGGTIITGGAAIESIFIITKTNLAVAGGYSFECEHINFKSAALGTTGPVAAIKNKIAGTPQRPFVVKNCNFTGFSKAIVSDISGTGGLTTGLCQAIIRENNFVGNSFSVYGSGGTGSILDLVFCDNNAENGGSIYISGLGGTFNISDNLMEGQADAIVLSAGLANGIIARNYFESNTGKLISFVASNPSSSLTLDDLYILNSTASTVTVSGCSLTSSVNFRGNCLFNAQNIVGTSVVRDSALNYIVGGSNVFPNTFDFDCISYKTNLYNPVITNGSWAAWGGGTITTPVGDLSKATTGAGAATAYLSPTMTTSIGDVIVLQFLVRYRAGSGNFYAAVYDDLYANGTSSNTAGTLSGVEIGEWVYCVMQIPAIVASTPTIKFRFVTSGTLNIDVTDVYCYSINSPTSTTVLPLVLPN